MGIVLACRVTRVILLLLILVSACTEATYYYELRAHVQIEIDDSTKTLLGDFSSYSSFADAAGQLVLLNDNFGCPGWNNNGTNLLPNRPYILFLRRTSCSDYEQASTAYDLRPPPKGLVFYYTPDSDSDSLSSKPAGRRSFPTMTVAITRIDSGYLTRLANLGGSAQVTVTGHYHQSFRTSQTFYFVVFAFCILMLLSCLWFLMSYMRRCHQSCRNRRRRAHTAATARMALNKLPVRIHKPSKGTEDPTCAVCLEAFVNNDTIRVLPCKHEFHKKCVDPWLKIKRTCPMCKRNILGDEAAGSRRGGRTRTSSSGSRVASSGYHDGTITPEERTELNRLVAAEEDEPEEVRVERQRPRLEEIAVPIEADPQSLPLAVPLA